MRYRLLFILYSILIPPLFSFGDTLEKDFFLYTLKFHNTLGDISRIFKVQKTDLAKLNPKKTLTEWKEGSILKIPLAHKTDIVPYSIKKGDSLYSIAKIYQISFKDLEIITDPQLQKNMWVNSVLYLPFPKKPKETPTPSLPVNQVKSLDKDSLYTVKKGDTYYGLAKKNNIPLPTLKEANQNKDLQKDMQITIPSLPIKDSPPLPQENKEQKAPTPPPFNGLFSSPYKGEPKPYSPLVPGVQFTVEEKGGKAILSPMQGVITDIKPVLGFGMGIFIENGETTVILASKGFYTFLFKKESSVKVKQPVAYVTKDYKLYFFVIKNGKSLPPF